MWWGGGQDGVKRGTIRVGGERDKTRLEGWTRHVGGGRQDMVWGQDVMGRVTRRGGKVDKRVDF